MTDRELLLRMKDILERMFDSEDEKHHLRIKLAKTFVEKELLLYKLCIETEILDINHLVAILLDPIFKERGLPSLPFNKVSNDES